MRSIYTFAFALLIVSQAQAQTQADNDTLTAKQQIQEVVVNGIKARRLMPVTQTTLTQQQIAQRYYGADLPTVLSSTPSINSYSDNGTGIGYSFFRLRGLDQTRINLTVNGIPVNDAESQGAFCNNFADLASSAGSIQVQRGVGTSTNGTAAFAGSVNVTTKALSETPGAEVNLGYGSFNSRRITAEYQTGLIDKKFAFYTRISNLGTDGYRQHSGSVINSMFLSGAYFGKKSLLKLNVMAGSTASQLSYTGIDKPTLDSARTTNYFTNGETDAFKQAFYQLQYSYQINDHSGFSLSGYYVKGNAPRFQYYLDGSYNTYAYMNMPDAVVGTTTLTNTDAIGSYRLNQNYYGGFGNYYYRKGAFDVNAGFHASTFISEHFMEVNWARVLPAGIIQNHQAYFNTGYKSEVSAYAKLNYAITGNLYAFGDVQVRNAQFKYRGKDQVYHRDTFTVEDMSWLFVNPKGGVRYVATDRLSIYGMLGMTTREPTRIDYLADEFPSEHIKQDKVKPESLVDFEFGVNYQAPKLAVQANAFYMDFTNQLVNTGKLNSVGYSITANVDKSYRAGVEFEFTWKPLSYLWFTNSTMIMQNEIVDYTQFYDSAGAYTTSVGVQYTNTQAALSPNLILNQGVRVIPFNWFYADVNVRHVAMQYLDNTASVERQIPSYTVVDMRLALNLKQWIPAGEPVLSFLVNNVGDHAYTPSGNTSGYIMNYDGSGNGSGSATGLYFPAPLRNYFVSLSWKF